MYYESDVNYNWNRVMAHFAADPVAFVEDGICIIAWLLLVTDFIGGWQSFLGKGAESEEEESEDDPNDEAFEVSSESEYRSSSEDYVRSAFVQ